MTFDTAAPETKGSSQQGKCHCGSCVHVTGFTDRCWTVSFHRRQQSVEDLASLLMSAWLFFVNERRISLQIMLCFVLSGFCEFISLIRDKQSSA